MVDQVGRKGSVTQTGTRATELQGPDLSGASFSRQGVIDQSGIFEGRAGAAGLAGLEEGIRGFGQLGLDIDEGLAKANLERELTSEIDAALESRDTDFAANQQAKFDEAAQELSVTEEKKKLHIEEQDEAAVERLDPDFANVTKKLREAKRQGAISLDEFELRTTEALRRAIAARPGLQQELSQHASNVLRLSGAREKLSFMDKLAQMEGQEEAERRNMVVTQLHKQNISFDLDAPTPQLEQRLMTKRMQDEAFEEGQRLRTIRGEVQREDGLQLLNQTGDLYAAGAFNNSISQLNSMFQPGMSAQELTAAKAQASRIALQFNSDFEALGRNLGVTNEPEFKNLRDSYLSSLEETIKVYQDAGSGEEAAAIARSENTVIDNQWKREVYQAGVNPEVARTASYLHPFLQFHSLLDKKPELTDSFTRAYESLVGGIVRSGDLDRLVTGSRVNGQKNDMALFVSSAADSALKENRPERAGDFEKMIDTTVQKINETALANPSASFKAQTDLINELANKDRNLWGRATADTKATLVDMGVRQAQVLERDRTRFLARAKDEGVDIRTRVLRDGTLTFETANDTQRDRTVLREFNRKFTNKYNDLIKFNANLFNMSVPDTSELLGEIYGGGSSQDIRNAISKRREGLVNSDISSSAKELIRNEEAFRENAYLDEAGIPTVGYGFTTINGRPVQLGDTISEEQAEQELNRQVKAHSTFKNHINVPLTKQQADALASFEFNLGPNIWNSTGRNIIKAINRGDMEAAAESMMNHNKIRDPETGELRESSGLSNRREREATLLTS